MLSTLNRTLTCAIHITQHNTHRPLDTKQPALLVHLPPPSSFPLQPTSNRFYILICLSRFECMFVIRCFVGKQRTTIVCKSWLHTLFIVAKTSVPLGGNINQWGIEYKVNVFVE